MAIEELILMVLLASIIGDFFIAPILRKMRERISGESKMDETKFSEFSRYVGMAERALYVLSWYFGHLEFIAAWFVFKAATIWKAWADAEKDIFIARARFNLYLLGNALSLLAATVAILLVLSI